MTYVAQMHKNTLEILLIDLRGKKNYKTNVPYDK